MASNLIEQELSRYRGDSAALSLALTDPDSGGAFNPTGCVLIFTIKSAATDLDTAALVQKISSVGGITVANPSIVTLVPADHAALPARITYEWDVQAQNITSGAVRTVARGTLYFENDVTKDLTLSIDTIVVEPGSDYLLSEALLAARDEAVAAAATATTQAGIATTQAGLAATAKTAAEAAQAAAAASAAAALASESAAAASAAAAVVSAATATTQAGTATTQAGLAATAKTAAEAAQAAALASQTAAAASAAAALASQTAAAASSTTATTQATNAATSASAAASSATTALNAVATAFLGTIAGGSVPATAAAAGRYYIISSAGTSQSVTWAFGDWAIYNGSSGSWSKLPSGAVDTFTLATKTNALGPRQALSQDGTFGSTIANVQAFGTKDFTVAVLVSHRGVVGYILGTDAAGSGFEMGIRANGNIFSAHSGSGFTDIATGLTAGVFYHLCYARTGGTGTFYVNGVSVGTQSDSYDYTSSNASFGKNHASTFPFTGVLALLGIENRALSAAEVLALNQTGAWPTTDYNSASNTSVIPAASGNFSTDTYFTKSSATINTGTQKCTITAGGNISRPSLVPFSKKFRVTVTVDSGVVNVSNGYVNYLTNLATGTYEFEAFDSRLDTLYVSSAAGAVLGSVSLCNLGLLCAPEANAPGNGYQWKDASGNKADIKLPTSGVAWALPDRRPNSVRGTLTWAGTHESKSLLGQRALPDGAVITLITAKPTVASSGSGMAVGTTNDSQRWSLPAAITTAKKVVAINSNNGLPLTTDAANSDVVVDPDTANYTGSIAVEVQYSLTEGT